MARATNRVRIRRTRVAVAFLLALAWTPASLAFALTNHPLTYSRLWAVSLVGVLSMKWYSGWRPCRDVTRLTLPFFRPVPTRGYGPLAAMERKSDC
jgi:hypothetical protein